MWCCWPVLSQRWQTQHLSFVRTQVCFLAMLLTLFGQFLCIKQTTNNSPVSRGSASTNGLLICTPTTRPHLFFPGWGILYRWLNRPVLTSAHLESSGTPTPHSEDKTEHPHQKNPWRFKSASNSANGGSKRLKQDPNPVSFLLRTAGFEELAGQGYLFSWVTQ